MNETVTTACVVDAAWKVVANEKLAKKSHRREYNDGGGDEKQDEVDS